MRLRNCEKEREEKKNMFMISLKIENSPSIHTLQIFPTKKVGPIKIHARAIGKKHRSAWWRVFCEHMDIGMIW